METAAAQHCRRIVRQSGSNFRHAFRFLNPDQRRAMTAVYAFCRVIDDIVDDGAHPPQEKGVQLGRWRKRVAQCADAVPTELLMHELAWAMRTYGIPARYLQELIDGVARDLDPRPVATVQDLLHYCYGVAGTVGLMCLRIFGVEETAEARAAAVALGNALQLTNMLRDLADDVRNGRNYLPREDLARFGVTDAQLTAGTPSPQVDRLIAFEIERAEGFFRQAWEQFAKDDAGRLRAARMMSACYYELLRRMRRHPQRIFRGRVRIPWWRKLRLLVASV